MESTAGRPNRFIRILESRAYQPNKQGISNPARRACVSSLCEAERPVEYELGTDQTHGCGGGRSARPGPVDQAGSVEIPRLRAGKGGHRRLLQIRALGQSGRGVEPV